MIDGPTITIPFKRYSIGLYFRAKPALHGLTSFPLEGLSKSRKFRLAQIFSIGNLPSTRFFKLVYNSSSGG